MSTLPPEELKKKVNNITTDLKRNYVQFPEKINESIYLTYLLSIIFLIHYIR